MAAGQLCVARAKPDVVGARDRMQDFQRPAFWVCAGCQSWKTSLSGYTSAYRLVFVPLPVLHALMHFIEGNCQKAKRYENGENEGLNGGLIALVVYLLC